jgi:hypothetical protein
VVVVIIVSLSVPMCMSTLVYYLYLTSFVLHCHSSYPQLIFPQVQTLQDLSISVPVPAGTKGKDVTINISRSRLKVAAKGLKEVVFDGQMYGDVLVDDCTWTIEDGPGGPGGERTIGV